MRLSGLVVTLPLLLSVSLLAGHTTSASAAALDPAQATRMLAKANAADGKCKILGATDNQELRDLIARAEISLAEKQSVKAARSAIASGKSAGQAMPCDATAASFVNSVLGAARGAMDALAQVEQPEALPIQPQTQAATLIVLVKPKISKPVKKATLASIPKLSGAETNPKGLNTYATLATKYYVELRCRSMSQQQVNRLYANVLSSHRRALASSNPQAVKAMLTTAESSARRISCS